MQMNTPQTVLNRLWKIKNGGTYQTKDKVNAADLVLWGKDHEMELIIEEKNDKYIVKLA